MPVLALLLLVGWLLIVAVVPIVARAGQGIPSPARARDRAGSAQWWARIVGIMGVVLGLSAPVAALSGMAPIAILYGPLMTAVGIVLYTGGIVVTLIAQAAMGSSWRGDVDPNARTELVTTGPFRIVRNPILVATELTALGLVLILPNVLSLAMLGSVLLAHQIQVRLVEEPYLLRVHGAAYARYAARTGRFLPGIGRLRPTEGTGGADETNTLESRGAGPK
jgi:protein-S-isoprenylcysteine O-methyltransferase Ste14